MKDVRIGDVATLRKPHPCGGTTWLVYRVGADIGLRCLTCNRLQLLPRSKFEKALKNLRRDDHVS